MSLENNIFKINCNISGFRKNWLKLITILAFMFTATAVHAFSKREYHQMRDSLHFLVEHSNGAEKADALFQLIRHIGPWEPDTSKILLKEEFELVKNLDCKTGLAKAYQNSGDLHFYRNEYTLAFNDYLNALKLFDEEKSFKGMGDTYFRLSMVYYSTANFTKCEQYFEKVIESYNKCKCEKELFITYLEIGYYYNNFKIDPQLAKQYHRKALSYLEQTNLSPFFHAATYISYELSYSQGQQYDSAIYILKQAQKYSKGYSKDEILLNSIIFQRLGNNYYFIEEYDSAMHYSKLSINEADKISFLYIKTVVRYNLARKALQSGNWQEALELYEIALNDALQIYYTSSFYAGSVFTYTNDWIMDILPGNFKVFSPETRKLWALRYIIQIYAQIANIYRELGNMHKTMISKDTYHAWKDTLNLKTKTLQLVGLQLNYETEIKDKQIENLKQESELKEYEIKQSRIMLFGASGLLVLGGLIVLLLFRQNKLKTEQERITLQQKLFRSQINPHFVFNSLTNIQHMILSEEAEQASMYLADFSTLVRSVLNSTITDRITYDQEIKIIKSYLELQKLRYENFEYKIEVDSMIDIENLTIPPMLAQPFIENAIEHGFKNKKEEGQLDIVFKFGRSIIVLEIIDNGIGRKRSSEIQMKQGKQKQSLSTGITRERIKVLNKRKTDKFQLQIIDLLCDNGEANGTKVIFKIPIETL
jgi:tetratricopeptide (TPR) repeat protein